MLSADELGNVTPAISCCAKVVCPGQTALKEASALSLVPAASVRRC